MKICKQKTTGSNFLRAQKLLRGGKSFVLRFGAFFAPKIFS